MTIVMPPKYALKNTTGSREITLDNYLYVRELRLRRIRRWRNCEI